MNLFSFDRVEHYLTAKVWLLQLTGVVEQTNDTVTNLRVVNVATRTQT